VSEFQQALKFMSDLPTSNNFILYQTPNGDVNVNVLLQDETIWLTQKMMAELFGVGVPAVNKHLTNIFETNELNENSVISILETTASDGKNYKTKFYNLDAIISVGYRVNSTKATQFRIWATQTLKEFIIKGFVLDDDRLKQGKIHRIRWNKNLATKLKWSNLNTSIIANSPQLKRVMARLVF
jgi:hypothetical protein